MAGYHYPGHTDLIAEMTNTPDYGMMYVTPTLTVVLATIHVALSEVPRMITKKRVLTMIRLTDQTMRKLGVKNPRIAVAGLNPHAGEAGMFGREEIEEITPAVEEARKESINVTDPLPADTVFLRAHRGQFDAVVSMYHDQGSIPIKLLGFERGVNMTIGLPIIRTSVDHGTAYGHARRGQGDSDPGSLIEAIKLAAKLAAPV
jgi:4-hydroxythreonine-4-phosphate dehydrogenase